MSIATGEEWYQRRGRTPRKCWVDEGVGYVPLTQGMVAMVDPAAIPECGKYDWTFTHGYARNDRAGKIYLHYFVMGLADGMVADSEIDHISGDTLDNRMKNLRWVDRWQNQVNRKLQSNNTSGYRGVYSVRGKWDARLKRKGVTVSLGSFDTPEEAAKAYDDAAIAYGGGVVRLNLEGRSNGNS